MTENTILGISPGSRVLGLAVLKGNYLANYTIRSFHGSWSVTKLRLILNAIDEAITTHGVKEVSVKVPDVLPLTKSFHQLIGAINVLCEQKNIRPRYYSLSEIKAHHGLNKRATIWQLLDTIVKKHSVLELEYRRELENSNAYYYRLFEAVAIAHL